MLRVVLRSSYAELVDCLAQHLSTPLLKGGVLERALAPEWVVTPSVGTRQWLRHELSERVGATNSGRRDGIVANWHHEFPGALTHRIVAPHLREVHGRDADPWALPELTFHVMEWAHANTHDAAARPLVSDDGTVLMGRARHFADLFDRYHVWRPDIIASWAAGQIVDSSDRYEVEQFALWRGLRRHINLPSPPERWSAALTRFENADIPLRDEWPNRERLSVFGMTAFPGGMRYVEAVQAIARHVDVTLYLVHGFDDDVLRDVHERSDFRSELLQMWGGLPLANAPVIQELLARADDIDPRTTDVATPSSLLSALQHTLRRDEVVATPDSTPPSVVEHWCHGPMRQAEVLRDAIQHDLENSPADNPLRESEILVVCSDIELFAPLIRTAFGASRVDATESPQPALAYRISDPRLSAEGAYLRAIRQALQLVRSRCTRTEVLSLLEAPPVAARRRLGSDELDIIAAWSRDAGVRWGLSAEHRHQFGLDAVGGINTWQAGLERLYLGVAVLNPNLRDVRHLLPVEVPAGRIDLLGNLTEIVVALEEASRFTSEPRLLSEWLTWCDRFISTFVEPLGDDLHEASRVTRALTELRQVADSIDVAITYPDFIAVLEDSWSSSGSVSRLLTGGITVTSADTLRWTPFRYVYVLGFDDEAFSRPEWGPDDLRRREKRVGDISPNDDARSRLSELILSTKERLTVFRNYRDLSNNIEVEFGTAFAEYRQALAGITGGSDPLVVEHPRHGFSRENFDPESPTFAQLRAARVVRGSWSHSELDHRIVIGARPHRTSPDIRVPLATAATRELTVRELAQFLRDPVATHLSAALGIRHNSLRSEEYNDLELELQRRDLPQVIRRLFDFANRDEGSTDGARQSLVQSGDIPPEHFGGSRELSELAEKFAEAYQDTVRGTQRSNIRLYLPLEGLTVIDDIEVLRRDATVMVPFVHTSNLRLRHVFTPWMQALVVRASTPDSSPVEICVVTLREEEVVNERLPVLVDRHQALEILEEVAHLYHVNLETPLPVDTEGNLDVKWSASEETWQDKGFRNNRGPRYLGKETWRLVFGELSVEDIDQYVPEPGWNIEKALFSLKTLLSRVVNISQIIDITEEGE